MVLFNKSEVVLLRSYWVVTRLFLCIQSKKFEVVVRTTCVIGGNHVFYFCKIIMRSEVRVTDMRGAVYMHLMVYHRVRTVDFYEEGM